MDITKLHEAKEIVCNALIEAGKKLKPMHGNIDHTFKGDKDALGSDIVTKLDKDTEKYLASEFAKFDKSIGFRGEESGIITESDTTWLVDPIDGTQHFVRGMPFCTSMVALIDKGHVVLSAIYNFVTDEMYWAIRGEGAYCNNRQIYVSDRRLGESLIAFESDLSVNGNMDLNNKLRKKTIIFQTINSGFEFTMVACGKLDGRIAKDPFGYDWDYAPGSLLVSEAGGVVRNIGNNSYDYKNHDYLITNQVIYKELTQGPGAIF